MAISRSRRRPPGVDYWPGFVDALSTLLLTVTFLMVLFMVAQYFAAQEASGKDTLLARLQKQIAQLAIQLSLERSQKNSALDDASGLRATLAASEAEKKRLAGLLGAGGSAELQVAAVAKQLDEQRGITAQALAQIELLNQQIVALRKQIAALEESRSAMPTNATRHRKPKSPISGSGSTWRSQSACRSLHNTVPTFSAS